MKTTIPETSPDFARTRTVERPDGFYWENLETGETCGPFETLAEAVNDMELGTEAQAGMADTLREAEDEIGISDWIDPDTGAPAEEQVPHIEDDSH